MKNYLGLLEDASNAWVEAWMLTALLLSWPAHLLIERLPRS